MSPGLGAEQLGHVTMFVADRDGPQDGRPAMPDDEVSLLPGLCVRFAPVKLAEDAVTADVAAGTHWPQDSPLGITGDPAIKIASPDPEQAAAELAVRAGRAAYAAGRSHLNAVGYGVRLDGYAVEFVGSATGSAKDLVGGFLVGHGGPGIFATTYRVRDLSAARAALAEAGVRFTQWGRHSLLLRVESARSAAGRIEFTDED